MPPGSLGGESVPAAQDPLLARHLGDDPTQRSIVDYSSDQYREWIGRPYDPAVFDPGEFTENLRNAELAAFENDPS